jgi:hypothetical protein
VFLSEVGVREQVGLVAGGRKQFVGDRTMATGGTVAGSRSSAGAGQAEARASSLSAQ